MKTFLNLSCLLLICFQPANSQALIESRLKDNVFIEELKQTEVDISGIYRKTLNAGQELSYYLLFLDNGKFYITKLTHRYVYEKIPLEESDFLEFYFPDKDSIQKVNMEEPQLNWLKDPDGKDAGREIIIPFYGTLEIITLWTTKESVYLYLESVIDPDLSNPSYYEYNLKLKYDPWLKKLIEQISGLERDGEFIRKDISP